MKLLEKEWEEFRREFLEEDMRPIRLTDFKRTYYSGALALFSLMIKNFEGEDARPDDQILLDGLVKEMREYLEQFDEEGT